MSQRVDERFPTLSKLKVYDKCLKLTDHTLNVCKIKDNGNNTKKHLVKRQSKIGQYLIEIVIQVGADILEANNKYVEKNLNKDDQIRNYKKRLELEEHAKSLTYRMEHIIRVLHFNRPFDESTIGYWIELLMETRELLIKWKESDYSSLKELMNNKGIC